MGRNTKGGKKHKKSKNKNNIQPLRKEIIFAEREYGQEYITITKMLGDGRCLGNSTDGRSDVLCIIRGSMRKKVWIRPGDIVLGSFRDFSAKPVADIIHKYTPDEAIELKKKGAMIVQYKDAEEEEDEDDIEFRFDDL